MSRSPAAPQRLAQDVAAHIEPIYAPIDALGEKVITCRRARGRLREEDLSRVAAMVRARLSNQRMYAGFGYVAEPGIVDSADSHFMLWWQVRGTGAIRLRLNLDPAAPDHYDYQAMPWFSTARTERRRVAHGPYVDYSGSELFTLTVTAPVLDGDDFLGITGADLNFLELERQLLGVLRRAGTDACVVNDEGRVIATNTARWVVSSRIRGELAAGVDGIEGVAPVSGGYGWFVVTGTTRP